MLSIRQHIASLSSNYWTPCIFLSKKLKNLTRLASHSYYQIIINVFLFAALLPQFHTDKTEFYRICLTYFKFMYIGENVR